MAPDPVLGRMRVQKGPAVGQEALRKALLPPAALVPAPFGKAGIRRLRRVQPVRQAPQAATDGPALRRAARDGAVFPPRHPGEKQPAPAVEIFIDSLRQDPGRRHAQRRGPGQTGPLRLEVRLSVVPGLRRDEQLDDGIPHGEDRVGARRQADRVHRRPAAGLQDRTDQRREQVRPAENGGPILPAVQRLGKQHGKTPVFSGKAPLLLYVNMLNYEYPQERRCIR